ncbi:MAG TPA: DNA-processing protein DprA [Nitrospiria bacterium]|nr:DNA-processing protein DprA [Nitrospiria bacterium]
MLDRDERYAWLALKAVPGIGDVLCKRVIERFGSPVAALRADPNEWTTIEGIGSKAAQWLRSYRPDDAAISRELDRIDEMEVDLIGLTDPRYPVRLRMIPDPPPILYLKGGLRPEDHRAVAIVGARRASGYGRAVTEQLSRDLATRGFTIVSGMARGIDAWAHQAALEVPARTIAVLGCGLDILYPPEHHDLRDLIGRHGAVVSEFPLGTQPDPVNFPKRNRVISGLSLGVVVVEAAEQSGSLITARLALDQGREVFAVPGPIGTKTSVGTHALIKQGAKLVDGVEDILDEIRPQLESPADGALPGGFSGQARPPALLPEERTVYECLSAEPRHIDELTAALRLPPAKTAGVLLQLELKGAIRQLAGNLFIRID